MSMTCNLVMTFKPWAAMLLDEARARRRGARTRSDGAQREAGVDALIAPTGRRVCRLEAMGAGSDAGAPPTCSTRTALGMPVHVPVAS